MTEQNPQQSQSNFFSISLFSIIIPGLGQFLQKKCWRGITIFISTILLTFLIAWALALYGIAKISLGNFDNFMALYSPGIYFGLECY